MKKEEESSSVVEAWYKYLEHWKPIYAEQERRVIERLDREREEFEGEVVEVLFSYPPETVETMIRLGIIKKEESGE